MIKCKLIKHPAYLFCCNLSSTTNPQPVGESLKSELKSAYQNIPKTPKTFPVEFKGPSYPPVKSDYKKIQCDRDVLVALSKANQEAVKKFDIPVPFSKNLNYNNDPLMSKEGNPVELKRAGYDVAQQFIDSYKESFKIRYPDKLSHVEAEMGEVALICKSKKFDEAWKYFNAVETDKKSVNKEELDLILDLFAYTCYGGIERGIEWREDGDCYFVYDETSDEHKPIPYSRCLYKALYVEVRNAINITSKKKADEIENREERDEEERKDSKMKLQRIASEPSEDKHLVVKVMQAPSNKALLPAQRVLKLLNRHHLTTANNFNTLIQAAVRHYCPKLAYDTYTEMLKHSLTPDMETLAMLVYSVTHNMEPHQFLETGAAHLITPILKHIAGNPDLEVTDEFYANLFYGVHMNPDTPDAVLHGIDRYNMNILTELENSVKQGALILRHSIAYKIVEALNHTIAGKARTEFTSKLNQTMYNLLMGYPESFKRDLDSDHGDHFLYYLLRVLDSGMHTQLNIPELCASNTPLIKSIMKRYLTDSEILTYPYLNLHTKLKHELFMRRKHEMYGKCAKLEETAKYTTWDYWKDIWRDSRSVLPQRMSCDIISAMLSTLESLDFNAVEPSYMVHKLKLYLHYMMEVERSHLEVHPNEFRPEPYIYVILESYVCLIYEFLIVKLNNCSSSECELLSETNTLDMVQLTCRAMKYLIEKGGIPSDKMASTVVLSTLAAGLHEQAWGTLNVFQDFRIPLDKKQLTLFIELENTPEFYEKKDEYLSGLYPALRDKIEIMLAKSQPKNVVKNAKVSQMDFIKGVSGKSLTDMARYMKPTRKTR